MDLKEAILCRHSVRNYQEKPLEEAHIRALLEETEACNREGGLHIQLVTEEPKAFGSPLAHYGMFGGVTNYFALVGPKGEDLDQLCGYYGQRLVLRAQQLGLNTCWVAVTYKKVPGAFRVEEGEKLTVVIALGYGKTQGSSRRSKSPQAVSNLTPDAPQWFKEGVEAALLAPTAMNQQKFTLTLKGDTVVAKAGLGPYAKMDLGIVKYNFEVGAGKENFTWE